MSSSSSSSSTSGSLFTPLQFTGISQYSSDFQSILSRAQQIAEIPVQSLQNTQSDIQQQETAISTLSADANAVNSALQAIGTLGAGGALTANSSDTSVVSATNTGATSPVTYNISDVSSLASAASETSQGSFTDTTTQQVSTTGSMQLQFGGQDYPITLGSGDNNLNGLVNAINALGAGVTASVITAGTNTDYLSVSANSPGATNLALIDDPAGAAASILTDKNQGSNTDFKLNNVAISSTSTTVDNVIPGVTLTFNGTNTSETVNVSLSTSRDQISSALQTLATAYNQLQTDNQTQIGSGSGTAGALSGNNILYQINQALNSIVQFQGGSGGISNIANLGLEINQNGQMTFDQDTFNALSDSQVNSALSLLGNSTTGIGGLQQAFTAITDPVSGSIAVQEQEWNTQNTDLTNQITSMTQQIDLMQQNLDQQLQATDASVAELSSQQNVLTASITSLDYTSYGYNSDISSPAF